MLILTTQVEGSSFPTSDGFSSGSMRTSRRKARRLTCRTWSKTGSLCFRRSEFLEIRYGRKDLLDGILLIMRWHSIHRVTRRNHTEGEPSNSMTNNKQWGVQLSRDYHFLICRYYLLLMPLFCFVLPTFIPAYFWGEDPWKAWYFCALARYALVLHGTWSVNSAAHMWGNRPYDKWVHYETSVWRCQAFRNRVLVTRK